VTVTGPFSYQVSGGTATVTCTGDDVSLTGASPAAGYTLTVESSGPQEARVEFENEPEDAESEIRVTCSNGVPNAELREH
jgi:hypothetical protein